MVKRSGENRYSMSLPRRPGVKLEMDQVPKVIKDEMMADKVKEVIKARDYMLVYQR